MTFTPRERCTAYHEATHAVVAHCQGMKLGEVTIVRDGDALGLCHATGGSVLAKAIYQISGSIGHYKFCRDKGEPLPGCGDSDLDGFEKAISILAPQVKEARARGNLFDNSVAQAVMTDAKIMVTQHWADITALAFRLLQEKTMRGTEVRAFLVGRKLSKPLSMEERVEKLWTDHDRHQRRMRNKSPRAARKEAEILLYGDIGSEVDAKMFAQELRGLGDVDHITVGWTFLTCSSITRQKSRPGSIAWPRLLHRL